MLAPSSLVSGYDQAISTGFRASGSSRLGEILAGFDGTELMPEGRFCLAQQRAQGGVVSLLKQHRW